MPEDNATSAPRVIGAFISISPVVVMSFEIVKALLVATKEVRGLLDPPISGSVMVPAPLVRVKLSVPLASD